MSQTIVILKRAVDMLCPLADPREALIHAIRDALFAEHATDEEARNVLDVVNHIMGNRIIASDVAEWQRAPPWMTPRSGLLECLRHVEQQREIDGDR